MELAMDKLRIGWRIRAMRYKRKLKKKREDGLFRCWKEKEEDKWKDIYSKERERFYNKNIWGINARELGDDGNERRLEKKIRREKDEQRQ